MDSTIDLLKALADRGRLRLVFALDERGELCACQLTELLGLRASTVSRHLAQLAAAGVVVGRKDGRWIHYRLTDGFAAGEALAWLRRATDGTPQRHDDHRALAAILAEDPVDLCRRQRGAACCPPAAAGTPTRELAR
jgi:ArsR family transcriptional regulator